VPARLQKSGGFPVAGQRCSQLNSSGPAGAGNSRIHWQINDEIDGMPLALTRGAAALLL
jgi:hypothetical protein